MKTVIGKKLYWVGVALLLVSLISSGLADAQCLCDDGDAELETICLSHCSDSGHYGGDAKSHELQRKTNSARECSSCIDVDLNLPACSARLRKDGLRYSNADPLPPVTEAALSEFPTYKTIMHPFGSIRNDRLTPIHMHLATTVIVC